MTNTLNGATTAAFVVALSQPLTEPVQVKWATKDGTGKAGTDYDAVSGSLTFAPGETSKQIQVTVYGRDPGQGAGDKSFYIVVEPPINAILDDTLVECTIVVMDEEGTPVTSVIVAQGRRGPKGEPGLSAYEQAVLMGYQGSIQDWMDDVADASQAAVRANTAADRSETAAVRAESAATSASFLGNIFPTPAAGVDPVTGVANGAYFNVRSPSSDNYLDEYQNVNGSPVASGKSFPSAEAVQKNVLLINAISELNNLYAQQGRAVFIKSLNSYYQYDALDTTTVNNGNTVIVDSSNRRWKLMSDFIFADKYNVGSIPKVFSAKYIMSPGQKNLGDISLRMRNMLEGSGYGTQLVDTTIDYNQNQVQLKDFRILNSDPLKYGVVNSDTAGAQAYFAEISNVTVNNGSGFKIGGVETYLNNCRVFSESRDNRVEKGFYCTEQALGDVNTAIDTSFSMLYSQGAKQGFNSRGAVIGYDLHAVWADTALRLEGINSLTALPTQRTIFGAYLDKAYTTAGFIYGATGVSLYSPFIYELGMYQTDTSQVVTGIRFQENSLKNFVCAPTFNVTDLSKVYSLLWFSSVSIDNTFLHLNGSYKLDSTHRDRMRYQNVIAGTGEWARHNNFARLNRAMTGLIAPNASVDVPVKLDYAYPADIEFDALLFLGSYITRFDNMDYQFGDIYIAFRIVNSGNIIPNIQIVPKGGYNSSNLSWAGTNATLVGNTLTLTLKNNATSSARMSVEIKRSVDTAGLAF